MRRYIYIGCVVFLLSLGLFSSVDLQNLDVNVYLLLLIIILFLVFLRGAPSKNPKFYHAAQCIVLANITAYISFKLYFGGPYTLLFAKHISFTIPLLILVILFIGSLFVLPLIRPLVDFNKLMYELIRNHFSKNSDRKSNSVALFYEHAKDKEHLRNLMQNFDIVGVSGAWGSGKSFVVDSFCNDSHDDYYIININVLAYKFGEADKVLVEKLNNTHQVSHPIRSSEPPNTQVRATCFFV
ncbi:MAG TPA: P-loop NTPase fold protein [Veillonellaceae bacterium]|nr:P-loop NTPase fold protein [Veillonellaceae bacterium]